MTDPASPNADRIAELETKLAKRRNTPGTGENVAAIEAEIARLKQVAE